MDFKIFMLGASGSGKTTLLACKNYKLCAQGQGKFSFFLEVEGTENKKTLAKLYSTIANPQDKKWPPGTRAGDISEWKFKCCVMGKDRKKYSPLSFSYIDYTGGFLIDGQHSERIKKELNLSHAIVGLIDGLHLSEALEKGYSQDLNSQMTAMCSFMQSTSNPSMENKVPLHYFVITKWDLLKNKKITLDDANQYLESAIPPYRYLVRRMNENQESFARVTPISSLGFSYVRLSTDSKLEKVGQRPEPFNVEVPIACLLPDLLQYSELKTKSKFPTTAVDYIKYHFFDIMPTAIDTVIPENYPISKKFLKQLSKYVKDWILENKSSNKEGSYNSKSSYKNIDLDKSLSLVCDEKTALKHIINCFLEIYFESTELR